MIMYFKKDTEHKVSETELLDLGNALKEFVAVYMKHIYLKDEKQIEILRRLEHIANLIILRKYDQLFDRLDMIDYDLDNYYDNDLPWYP